MGQELPKGSSFSIRKERRHMKKFIWWTATGLLAVIVLCAALTCDVCAKAAQNGEAGEKTSAERLCAVKKKGGYGIAGTLSEAAGSGGGFGKTKEKAGGDTDGEEVTKPSEPVLTGMVLHTEEWERNRKNANRFYRERGKTEELREPHIFWSGEKFVLRAFFEGESPPASILVRIKGTDYKTRIFLSEGIYKGELFDEDMLYRRGQNRPEELVFLFETEYSAEGGENKSRSLSDSCSVTVDDRQPYFMLHRKK